MPHKLRSPDLAAADHTPQTKLVFNALVENEEDNASDAVFAMHLLGKTSKGENAEDSNHSLVDSIAAEAKKNMLERGVVVKVVSHSILWLL
jgi:hypothetical protein